MTIDEAMRVLKRDRDLCMFNPTTGECEPMNEDCRRSAEAYDVILSEWENYKKLWKAHLNIVAYANKVMECFTKIEDEILSTDPNKSITSPPFGLNVSVFAKGMAKRQKQVLDIIEKHKTKAFGYGGFRTWMT